MTPTPTPLFLALSGADPRSLTRQITDGIRVAIASAELPPGALLPSVRGLATQLTLNPKTVQRAYDELVAEGWLYARQGLGVFVATPPQRLSDAERQRRLTQAVEALRVEVIGLGYTVDEVVESVRVALRPVLAARSRPDRPTAKR